MTDKPKFENAPGLVVRARKDFWVAFWQCRTDLHARGFRPLVVRLWQGVEPSAHERAYVSDHCVRLQDAMLVWGRGGLPKVGEFNGTIRSLADCFEHDPDSTFHKLRYAQKRNYRYLLRRIVDDHGDEEVANLKGRDMLRWHETWKPKGVPMAHGLMRMVRQLFSFGMTLLEDEQCARMSTVLHKMRFEMGKAREERLTADNVIDIRIKAHVERLPSIALAQAIQFECALRQKDIIGEWVPESEPGTTDVFQYGMKWLRGIRWNEIDDKLILRHVTSKRQKMIEADLRLAPMVLEEFRDIYGLDISQGIDRSKLPASGPVIVDKKTGLPFLAHAFRRHWRKIARSIGIPDTVRNMDSRAGAITEATDSGADLESVRHMATHSDIAMTQKYSRDSGGKTATVMKLRIAHRNKTGT